LISIRSCFVGDSQSYSKSYEFYTNTQDLFQRDHRYFAIHIDNKTKEEKISLS